MKSMPVLVWAIRALMKQERPYVAMRYCIRGNTLTQAQSYPGAKKGSQSS